MRKKELIDAVVERSGVKKKDAKPVVEAMLEILGEALADNRELNLLPMGKFKVVNEKDLGNGKMMRVKVRQVTPTDKPKDADAATDETDI
ncbi:MAG: HU family DNA-binding protein [Sulfitobacter sp.]|nr:HU family DNA-binding protein [Sulfitobacter sp.]